ncbi:MAG: metallopeptidase family protein [Oceanibaculum sp.]|nr:MULTISPECIES: metallopeptidase family protein [Oceanibaculum]MCH2395011.1 metallopeptidase family protein [Oceanibaculum sp.]
MKTPIHTTAPSLEDIEEMALAALQVIPDPLRQHVRDVLLRIEDFPDEDTELEMGVETPFDLLGLYRGVAMTNRSLLDVPQDVDMIFLYRRPILDYWCETGEDLQDIVRHVLIHEIGHHFGYSDEDMEAIEEQD